MTDVPDYIAGARALLAATSDCTINGEPAVVVRVAELNDLVARVHEAEAAALPEPAAILAVVETAIGDQLTDSARTEALDGIRRMLAAARTTPDNPAASGEAADNPAVAAPATAGRATVTIAIHAPDQDNADRWAGAIRDLVVAEHGHHMRLDITVGSGEAGR